LAGIIGASNKEKKMANKDELEPTTATLAETDTYLVWSADEPDGETTYHLELNNVTMHFFKEEWDEFLVVTKDLKDVEPDEDGFYTLDFDNVLIFLSQQEWNEFTMLIGKLK